MPKKQTAIEVLEAQEYVCMVPCWHMSHRFRKGQTAFFTDEQLPKDKKGKMLHFELINPIAPPPPPEEGPVVVNEKSRPEK